MKRLFDGVMVCTGHHTQAHWPSPAFPGQSHFKGRLMHSHSYNCPSSFKEEGKCFGLFEIHFHSNNTVYSPSLEVVVVVGIGNVSSYLGF